MISLLGKYLIEYYLGMKKLYILSIVLFSLNSIASNCKYFMERDYVNYYGYTIDYGRAVESVMSKLKFDRSANDQVSFEVRVKAFTKNIGQFNHSIANLDLIKNGESIFFYENKKRCLTTYCSTSDIAKSIKKLLKKVKVKLDRCQ